MSQDPSLLKRARRMRWRLAVAAGPPLRLPPLPPHVLAMSVREVEYSR